MSESVKYVIACIILFNIPACYADRDANKETLLSTADRQLILQHVIDDKALQPYYHVDVLPERAPLVVVSNQFVQNIRLQKFNQDVQFVERAEIERSNRPYIEISKLNRQDNGIVVVYSYPVEGIHGEVHLVKSSDGWTIKNSKLVER